MTDSNPRSSKPPASAESAALAASVRSAASLTRGELTGRNPAAARRLRSPGVSAVLPGAISRRIR